MDTSGPKPRLSAALSQLHAAGLGHVFLAIVAIQGAAYITQLVLAGILGPESFGVVRQTESLLAILLVIGSAGMPSLAVSLMARTAAGARVSLLRRLIGVAVTASVLTATVVAAVALAFGATLLAAIVGVICLSTASRTWFAYFQGIQQPHRTSVIAASMSLVSVPVICALTYGVGLGGWVLGRYLGELLLLGAFLSITRVAASEGAPDERRPSALLRLGMPVAISLLLRAAIDQSPILLLGRLDVSSASIGFFGFGTLIVTALMLVSASAGAVLVPRFSKASADPAELRPLFVRSAAGVVGAVLALTLITAAAVPLVTEHLLPEYAAGNRVVWILLACAPLRALASVAGGVLLAVDRNVFTAIANVILLGAIVGLVAAFVPSHGVEVAAWILVGVELAGAIAYSCWAMRASAVVAR